MIAFFGSRLRQAFTSIVKKSASKTTNSHHAPSYLAALTPKIGRALYYVEKLRGLDTLGDCLAFGYDNSHVMDVTMKEIARSGNEMRFFGFDSSTYLSGLSNKRREKRYHSDANGGVLIRGRYSNTLTAEEKSNHILHKASVVLIDAQLHSSIKQALEFCFPLVPAHAMIIFYNCNSEERFWGANDDAVKVFRELLLQNRSLQSKELELHYNNGRPDCRIFLLSNVYYQQKLAMVSKHLIKQGDFNLGEFAAFPVSDN